MMSVCIAVGARTVEVHRAMIWMHAPAMGPLQVCVAMQPWKMDPDELRARFSDLDEIFNSMHALTCSACLRARRGALQ